MRETLLDGSWGRYHGERCQRLQSLLAESHQVEHVVLTCSGTAAVELALRGLGVVAGDEVILSAYDFKGNFQDVLALGAIPVLVDICPDDWSLDVAQVAAALGPKVKAIIASHLHGAIVEMPALRAIADGAGVPILEDACQAPLARVHGRTAGIWGDVGVLSFGGSKLVTAGRGGAVFTRRADIAQRIRLHVLRGNDAYPLSELQGAALIPQWEFLPEWNQRRSVAVEWLRSEFTKSTAPPQAGVHHTTESAWELSPFPVASGDSGSAFYKWGMRYESREADRLTRNQFAIAVRAEGIALDPGLRSLHKIHSARRFRTAGDLSEATRADAGILTLHHPVLLGDESDLAQIPAAIHKIRTHAKEIREWFVTEGRSLELGEAGVV
ncbi:MAG: aminotransferase class V-fold PLP-dependent enzyme [Planctomycetota bacterium]|nr:aminotransferase class V-fold PLP-dependent enzyme [Planctomycetota bacterium]